MALQAVGVELTADKAAEYLGTLTLAERAELAVGAAAELAASAINILDSAMAAAGRGVATFSSDADMAARDAMLLGSNADAAGKGLDALGTDADQAAKAAADLGDKADAAGTDAKGLGKDAEGAGKAADDFGGKAKKAGDDAEGLGEKSKKGGDGLGFLERAAKGAAERVGELATEGLAAAGEAVLEFAVNGVKAAGDFEQGMNRFAAVTGESLDASGQSLDDFKELFISLGRELPVSTAEVQQAAIEMAKGGIEPATIAAGGLKTALDLAAAGEVGIAESAEILSKQLGVWVDKAADAGTKSAFLAQSADLLSQAANASTVDVDELALGLANVGGVAKLAGMTFEETVTTMAGISAGFSSAADAGTSLKTMLGNLQPSTEAEAQALAELGLLTEEGTSKFYDAAGSFIGMEQASELLRVATKDLTEAEKEKQLRLAFGQDAIRAAGMLAEMGAEGYKAMAAQMLAAGSAAQQAAAKQQGFNVAVDNLMGSAEALQITLGLALMPTLTSLTNLIAGGVNAITDYAQATMDGTTALAAIASTVSTLVIPALYGLTAATLAYGVVQLPTMIAAVTASIPAIAAQAAAFWANAAAVAAAAAPYAVIALAIGGVAFAYQDLMGKIDAATTQLLEGRQFWIDSGLALDAYATASDTTKAAIGGKADALQRVRDQLQGEVESLGLAMAAGEVSEAEYQQRMATINSLANTTQVLGDQIQAVMQAEIDETAASMTATAQAATMAEGTAELSEQVSLTAKDIEELGKKIQETYQKGGEALGAYVTTQSEFLGAAEERQAAYTETVAKLEAEKAKASTDEQKAAIDEQIKQAEAGYKDQEGAAAASYVEQQAAQKAHLGQMLIDYTVNQALLGNISKEKASEITRGLETEYGLQESSSASTFLKMAQSIDKYASDSGGSIDELITDLDANQQAAADTQQAMDDYAKEYTATAVHNFVEAGGDANDYIDVLEDVPKEVKTQIEADTAEASRDIEGIDEQLENLPEDRVITITVRYKEEGKPDGLASGGPVNPGQLYLVGEEGPELFMSRTPGEIINAPQTRSMLASPSLLSGGMGAGISGGDVTNLYLSISGGVNMADVMQGVRAGLQFEGRSADIRIRAGT